MNFSTLCGNRRYLTTGNMYSDSSRETSEMEPAPVIKSDNKYLIANYVKRPKSSSKESGLQKLKDDLTIHKISRNRFWRK